MSNMTPKEIVSELDRFIIGQEKAKKAVAIALRNRWRRIRLNKDMRQEVTPKNILMVGPTGVGKTEIARRLAKLSNAPFIKIEATKFTEVGYVGKDVDSIIRDLVDIAIKIIREKEKLIVSDKAQDIAKERILDALLPSDEIKDKKEIVEENNTRKLFRKKLNADELNNKEIEIELSLPPIGMEIMGPPGMEEMTHQLQNIFSSMSNSGVRKKRKKMKIKDALKFLKNEEANKLINEDEIKVKAINSVEENGIVFIDEIDKVCRFSDNTQQGSDVSRQGVQRDLLPLVEGSSISTKYGIIKTDHILFIASGAFHNSKPSDLIPELQGRFPIRVELSTLKVNDFFRILNEPYYSLIKQYIALLSTEGLILSFNKKAIQRLAEISYKVNEEVENIGARRLHTILELLLEEISFNASESIDNDHIKITDQYVNEKLSYLVKERNLSQYIL